MATLGLEFRFSPFDVPRCLTYHGPDVHVSAIIAAGGRGVRFGAAQPKQLLTLAGVPILQYSVDAFIRCDLVTSIVVALPPELVGDPNEPLRVQHAANPAGLADEGSRLLLLGECTARPDSTAQAVTGNFRIRRSGRSSTTKQASCDSPIPQETSPSKSPSCSTSRTVDSPGVNSLGPV